MSGFHFKGVLSIIKELIHFPSPSRVGEIVFVVCSKNTEFLIMKLIIIRDVEVVVEDLRNGEGF